MSAKLFGLEGSTVRRLVKLFALDGSTPRRVKKLFALDGSTVRLIFEDFSTFTASGTANVIVSPVNEVVDFGVRTDFNAGGADVSVNTSGTGDASNVGVTGITIDVDSSHTYSSSSSTSGARSTGSTYGQSGLLSPTTNFGGAGWSSGNQEAANTAAELYARLNGYGVANGALQGNSLGFNPPSGTAITRNGVTSSSFSTVALGAGTFGNANMYRTTWSNGVILQFDAQGSGHLVQPNNGFPSTQSKANNGAAIIAYPYLVGSGTTSINIPFTSTSTGRRARVQNGTNRTFTINSGGLTAGGNFATGGLSAGASTSFITANSTSEAWTLVGVAQKNPATFVIANANNSIQVSGTFGDGENATQARDRIQSVLNGNSTFQGKFNTGVDSDKTISGVAHKVVTFTSDSPENTNDFSITVTANDGSNTAPYEATTTQGATQSLQTTVQVTRAVEGSSVSSTKAISSQANTDTAGAEVATLGGDISYDSSTNKLKVQDVDATINVSNAGSLSFSKD